MAKKTAPSSKKMQLSMSVRSEASQKNHIMQQARRVLRCLAPKESVGWMRAWLLRSGLPILDKFKTI